MALALAIMACSGSGGPTATAAKYFSGDVEYQLAVIDTGADPPSSLVDQYSAALDRTEVKCVQERRMVGDMATRAMQIIAEEYGKDVATLEMIRGVDDAIPDGETMDCAETFAVMIALIGGN